MVKMELSLGTASGKDEEAAKRQGFLDKIGEEFGYEVQNRLDEFWNGLLKTPLLLPTEPPDQALLQNLVSQHYKARAHDSLAETPVKIISKPKEALKTSSNRERSIDLGWFEQIEKSILSDANLTRKQISTPLTTHTMAIAQGVCAGNYAAIVDCCRSDLKLSLKVIQRVTLDAGRDFSQMAFLNLFTEWLKENDFCENPLGPLSDIWEKGIWPIGRVKKPGWLNFDWRQEEEFVIFSPRRIIFSPMPQGVDQG